MGAFGNGGGSTYMPPFDPRQMTGNDRLMMLGAMLSGMGAAAQGRDSNDIAQARNYLMGRNLMGLQAGFMGQLFNGDDGAASAGPGPVAPQPSAPQQITPTDYTADPSQGPRMPGVNAPLMTLQNAAPGAFGSSPVVPQARRGGRTITPQMAAMGDWLGLNMKDAVAAQGQLLPKYEQGVRYSPGDPNMPDYIPKQMDGVRPIYGPGGAFQGVDLIRGAPQSAEAMAAATAGGTEEGKLPFTTQTLPSSSGASIPVPGDLAQQYLRAKFLREHPEFGAPGGPLPAQVGGQPGAAPATQPAQAGGYTAAGDPSDTGELGRTPTDAEKKLAEDRAATQGEREKNRAQAQAAVRSTNALIDQTEQAIHRTLGDVRDPKTGRWIEHPENSMIHWYSAGNFGAGIHALPFAGQKSRDLQTQLDYLRGLVAYDKLNELRSQAESGGLQMRVTQGEILGPFGNMFAALDHDQSPEMMTRSLRAALGVTADTRQRVQQQYDAVYGGIQQPTPGRTQPIPPGGPRVATAPRSAPRANPGASGYRIVAIHRGGQ